MQIIITSLVLAVILVLALLVIAVRHYKKAELHVVALKKATSEFERKLADELTKREIVWASDLFHKHQRDGEDEFEGIKEFYCCDAEPIGEILVELGLSEKRVSFTHSVGAFGIIHDSTLYCYKDFEIERIPELVSQVIEALGKKVSQLEKAREAFASLCESLSQ